MEIKTKYAKIYQSLKYSRIFVHFKKECVSMDSIMGSDRRKYRRLPIELHLEVDEVFKQDNIILTNIGALIQVFDISRSGIGFISDAVMPLGYYFRGLINLGDGDFFRVVIQIIRVKSIEDNQVVYGAEFVGLAPFLADKVDRYEKRINN